MRILVTDGSTRSALATTRSLGRAGHEIVVVSHRVPAIAGVSRYAREFLSCPNPQAEPQAFIDFVVDLARQRSIELVLPMTDVSTSLLAAARHRLHEGCTLPVPPSEVLAQAADKAYVLSAAQRLGIPVPASRTLNSRADVAALPGDLQFPLVIKPARSRVLANGSWISTSVSYAESRAALSSRLDQLDDAAFPVLLQERIQGAGVGVFACIKDGAPVALFSHRRIREKPPSGGVSVLAESTALDPLAVKHAVALLADMGWLGVAMVEFKRDDRDGSLRLMEVNGRFWGSLQLSIDAGVDFPRLLIDAAARGSVPPAPPHYRVGVRTRWFWGDVDSLLAVLTKPASALALPPNFPGRLQTLWQFLDVWRPGQRGEMLRADDPLPGLLETWDWIRGRR